MRLLLPRLLAQRRPLARRLRSLTRLVGVRPWRLLPPIRRLLLTKLLPLPRLLRLPVLELLRLASMLCPRRRELLRVLSVRLLRCWRTLILIGSCETLRRHGWLLRRLLLARVLLARWLLLRGPLRLGRERRPLLGLLPLARLLLRRPFLLLRLLLRRPNLLRPPRVRLVVVCLSRGRLARE
ncbi:hypothetical protein EV643_1184 [Kribbella sp. VKM Ac-2527]|uniref:Uncharacterized protein n=1 Tax=Kribbella caucasensis TaxID=2512215 RepID=A0A4R6K1X2_9ACTN|nr:hypothetical protein [Kribbella sp. VKM Ac-2527]TDO43263.1 hypothetical protein EV643_1184 [Kribbella sp. VKM Ac-2527]